jgi:hypothetical protein
MSFTVIKRDPHGQEQLRYSGELMSRGETWVCIRAIFQFNDRDLGYMTMNRGDVFTEWFYADRWYNVFRVEDGKTAALKGWYCNFTRPAKIGKDFVSADDLALDVFVHPIEKTLLVLDEDDYEALHLPENEHQSVQNALDEIRRLASAGTVPFDTGNGL